jgi:hypothetical protein
MIAVRSLTSSASGRLKSMWLASSIHALLAPFA